MDEKNNQINSKESPFRALDKIDETLASAYPAPGKYKFSEDETTALIQKAVLYHRIRENPSLREGVKSVTNDIRYEQLAEKVTGEKDILAEFIKVKPQEEQQELLESLTRSDQHKPWFEEMLMRSEDKKAEFNALKDSAGMDDKLKAEGLRCQSNLYLRLADFRNSDPKTFLSNPENLASMKRMLAVKLHQNQIEHEQKELEESLRYETPEKRAELLKSRAPFAFEKAAMEDVTGHLKRLESTPEVTAQLYRMLRANSMEEMGEIVDNPPSPGFLIQHENIGLMENKMVPDAVSVFLSGPNAPEKDSPIYKALFELTKDEKKNFPDNPTEADCEKRIKEYQSILKKLGKSELADTEGAKELTEVLNGQIDRLQDVALSPQREKIQLSFKANTLIDYVDVNDPERKPMDAIQAREKLLRGAELEQITFGDDDFVGTSRKVTFDKKTGLINKGPEKLITRYMNLSEKDGKKPELQLEDLRKIKEVLKKSDPFYVKNSESFNNVMNSLNKVIKAQESMDKEANVRQVAELRALYAELDSNAAKYVKDKADRLKTGDDRAQIRLDAIRTLQSITGEKHVGKVTLKLYDEQKKMDDQQLKVKPCEKIMNKWKNKGTPTTPEGIKEFQNDFKALSERIDMIQKQGIGGKYFNAGMAEAGLEQFTKQAEEVQKKLNDPADKENTERLNRMKAFAAVGKDAQNKLNALPKLAEEPKKKIEAPEKKIEKANEPLIK